MIDVELDLATSRIESSHPTAVDLEVGGVRVVIDGQGDAARLAQAAREALDGRLDGLRDLRGAFAGLAWDRHRRRGVLFRDHAGLAPLFYALDGRRAWIGHEIRDVLGRMPVRPAPDDQAVARWLAHAAPGDQTLYRGIRSVPPAHVVDLPAGTPRPFWRPRARSDLRSAQLPEARIVLLEAVDQSVERHGGARGDASVSLSGGLDSATVLLRAAAIRERRGIPAPPAHSLVFPDRAELDETPLIDAVARSAGADVTRHRGCERDVLADSAGFMSRFEVPQDYPNRGFFAPLYAAAAGTGCGLVLDGEGGDELFGCVPVLVADLLRRGRPGQALATARNIPGMPDRLHRRAVRVVLRQWVIGALEPAGLRRRRQAGRALGPNWLLGAYAEAIRPRPQEDWRRLPGPRWLAQLRHAVVDMPALRASADFVRRNAAAEGATCAHPFWDPDLVETVMGLPPELAFDRRYDRWLLRCALAGRMPDEIRLRVDKTAFNALPLESLQGPAAGAIDALFDGSPEIGRWIDADRLRHRWQAARHEAGASLGWGMEIWRAATAEAWLRREAGR